VASGVASVGVLAGFSLVGSMPANAATDADCSTLNTATANAGGTNASDIQTLLTAHTPIICLVGTFNVATTLTADYTAHGAQLTIHGLSGAVLDGGGTTQMLYDVNGDTATIENITFANGFVSAAGGAGSAISGGSVEIHNSDFHDNHAGLLGGAVYGKTIKIYDSTFEQNTAALGGAVLAYGSVTATRSTFHDNTAVGQPNSQGGAIISGATATVDSSTFDGNQAALAAGAVGATNLYVTNSTFKGNSTSGNGDSTSGAGGGGALLVVGNGTILQSTFWDNSSSSTSGGQAIHAAAAGKTDSELDIRGNIFSEDASTAPQVGADGGATLLDLGGNLFTTTAASETSLPSPDPSSKFGVTVLSLFGPTPGLADNGGPTKTVALSSTSVAIDAVPAGSPSVTVDQRGVARTGLSDAGAYEAPLPVPALAATGAAPSTWIGGVAALLLAAGAAAFGLSRRRVRTH